MTADFVDQKDDRVCLNFHKGVVMRSQRGRAAASSKQQQQRNKQHEGGSRQEGTKRLLRLEPEAP